MLGTANIAVQPPHVYYLCITIWVHFVWNVKEMEPEPGSVFESILNHLFLQPEIWSHDPVKWLWSKSHSAVAIYLVEKSLQKQAHPHEINTRC